MLYTFTHLMGLRIFLEVNKLFQRQLQTYRKSSEKRKRKNWLHKLNLICRVKCYEIHLNCFRPVSSSQAWNGMHLSCIEEKPALYLYYMQGAHHTPPEISIEMSKWSEVNCFYSRNRSPKCFFLIFSSSSNRIDKWVFQLMWSFFRKSTEFPINKYQK